MLLFRARHPQLPAPERDYEFAQPRKFKADFAWCDQKVLVELDGGGTRSRHATVKGYANDCDKQNLAMAAGWRVLRFNVIHLRDMESVVDLVAKFLT